MLRVSKNKIVFLDMSVFDDKGILVETTDGQEAFSYIHGRGNLLPALEFYLSDKCAGFECEIVLEADQAFGDYYPELVTEISPSQLSNSVKLEEGEFVQTDGPHGVMQFKIEQIDNESVRLNANHPLAGKTLTFVLKVLAVKEPHRDEIRHRRPHPAGHHLMVAGQ